MGGKVCSKCCIVKGVDDFYATGNVCKECKRGYARLYRMSKNNDTLSCTTNSSIGATNDVVLEQLYKLVHTEEVNRHWINLIAEHVQRIDSVLGNLYKSVTENARKADVALDKLCIIEEHNQAVLNKLCNPKQPTLTSYPLTDIDAD